MLGSRVTLADGNFEFCVQLRHLALRRGGSDRPVLRLARQFAITLDTETTVCPSHPRASR